MKAGTCLCSIDSMACTMSLVSGRSDLMLTWTILGSPVKGVDIILRTPCGLKLFTQCLSARFRGLSLARKSRPDLTLTSAVLHCRKECVANHVG